MAEVMTNEGLVVGLIEPAAKPLKKETADPAPQETVRRNGGRKKHDAD